MAEALRVALEGLRRVGTVDERFQSYNVEMAEVIGGRFWKPYPDPAGVQAGAARDSSPALPAAATPAGMDPGMYEYRPPIDLAQWRLRVLAAALGPAYLRVSGTWANTVYFHDSDGPAPPAPPPGFGGVLTRGQWRGAVEFARAVNARLVSSAATSAGARDTDGRWRGDQARRLLECTAAAGGRIAAFEFMNEPTYAAMGGAPDGYDAAWYGRDIAAFRAFLQAAAPDATFAGPGSVGEGGPAPIALGGAGQLASADLLAASGGPFDVFSYHFYGAVSQRGAGIAPGATTTAGAALGGEWLSRTDQVHDYYAGLRDRFAPGAPMWVTETAQAAAGGDAWAATFTDTFRYLYQLGSLARRGVQVIMHNTLASSDYGLLDQSTLAPRPNYWAALLWHELMGTAVLDPGLAPPAGVYLFAHTLRGDPAGATLLVINASTAPCLLELGHAAERYTLSAARLSDTTVSLNGRELALVHDAIPQLTGDRLPPGTVTLEPATITFLTTP